MDAFLLVSLVMTALALLAFIITTTRDTPLKEGVLKVALGFVLFAGVCLLLFVILVVQANVAFL